MPDCVNTAQHFITAMLAEEYAKGLESFDASMRAAVNDIMLADTFNQMVTLFGKPLRHASTRLAKTLSAQADIVYLSWEFERERVDFRMVVNSANKIAGLSFETPVTR